MIQAFPKKIGRKFGREADRRRRRRRRRWKKKIGKFREKNSEKLADWLLAKFSGKILFVKIWHQIDILPEKIASRFVKQANDNEAQSVVQLYQWLLMFACSI